MRHRNSRRGSSLIEFTLVGIPLIFVLISIFEIARGMWVYNTLAHALKQGNRYVIVHGNNCTNIPNSCFITIRDAAIRIRDAGAGLVPTDLQNLQFISTTRTVTCPTLQACIQAGALGNTFWPSIGPVVPPANQDVGGGQDAQVEIRGRYRFRSAIAMFWPGAGPGMTFGTFLMPASSRERVQY
jgi:Flp pilus assembly protein TadG